MPLLDASTYDTCIYGYSRQATYEMFEYTKYIQYVQFGFARIEKRLLLY